MGRNWLVDPRVTQQYIVVIFHGDWLYGLPARSAGTKARVGARRRRLRSAVTMRVVTSGSSTSDGKGDDLTRQTIRIRPSLLQLMDRAAIGGPIRHVPGLRQ